MSKIYLDYAATTPISEEVISEMISAMRCFGNPSSTHSFGQEAKILIENQRRKISDYLNVMPSEIIFTSCGTESNNMIIKSCVTHLGVSRIISTEIEHKCVMEAVIEMKNLHHIDVEYLSVNEYGEIDFEDLERYLQKTDKKTLVTLMHANNEIGNLLDIEIVSKICKKYGALLHSDTVQTMAHLQLDFQKIPIDFASCSAHKFHGPKGSGFAFIRKNTGLKSLINGGGQERNLRSGTENVAGIVGLGKAFELYMKHFDEYKKHISEIKNYCISELTDKFSNISFNGRSADLNKSLYTVLSVLLPFYDPLIGMKLDLSGIAISQGSACSSGAAKPSSVISKIISKDKLNTSTPLRLSFSHTTTKDEIDELIKALQKIEKSINR